MRSLAGIFLILLVAACTAHNPFNVTPAVDSAPGPSGKTYPAHANRIFVTKVALPPGADYEVLETIDVGSNWYGGDEDAERMMADRARAIGADAVILVKTWHQPSGFSWSAPHGSGQAVKLGNPDRVDLDAVPGGWFQAGAFVGAGILALAERLPPNLPRPQPK